MSIWGSVEREGEPSVAWQECFEAGLRHRAAPVVRIGGCGVTLTIDVEAGLYTITDTTGDNIVRRTHAAELDALLDFCHACKSHGRIIPRLAARMLKRALTYPLLDN